MRSRLAFLALLSVSVSCNACESAPTPGLHDPCDWDIVQRNICTGDLVCLGVLDDAKGGAFFCVEPCDPALGCEPVDRFTAECVRSGKTPTGASLFGCEINCDDQGLCPIIDDVQWECRFNSVPDPIARCAPPED